MGLFKKDKTEDKLPLLARRGVVDGKKQNYLERYECPRCDGLFRSTSALNNHNCK